MLAGAIHCFFDEHGFFWVNRPIITASGAEGAGALFPVSTLDFATLPRTVDLMAFGEPRRALIKTRSNARLPPSSESSGRLANGCSGA